MATAQNRLHPVSSESPKQEKHIQIGKHNFRIANDHHALLVELQNQLRYMPMESLLFFTSFFGARVILLTGIVKAISVEKSK